MSDESEILKIIAQYCHAIDERRGAGLSELFTEDALFTMRGNTIKGGRAIEAHFVGADSPLQSGIVHLAANPIIEISGDQASGTVDHVLLRQQDHGAFSVVAVGRWVDRDARVGGEWCFAERSVQHPVPPAMT
jgi:hypothetical protein